MSDKLAGGVKAGSISVSLPVLLTKTSDGTEQISKIYSDVTASYWRQGGSRTAITTAALTNINDAWSSGGWKEVDSTNQPGMYRLDIPDAAFATGADWVIISVKVTGCFVYQERINLETVGAAEVYGRIGAAGASLTAVGLGSSQNFNNAGQTSNLPANVKAMATDVLDANALKSDAVTEITTGIPAAVKTAIEAAGSSLDTLLSRLTSARAGYLDVLNGIVAAITTAVDSSGVGTLLARLTSTRATKLDFLDENISAAKTLTTGERTAIANEVEAHLLNEGDSQMLINAIVGAIGNTNIDQAVLIAAIRADLERTGGNLNTVLARITEARLAKLDVSGTLANTANADNFKADVSGLATTSALGAVSTIANNTLTQATNAATSAGNANTRATDIQSRIPAALDGDGRMMSSIDATGLATEIGENIEVSGLNQTQQDQLALVPVIRDRLAEQVPGDDPVVVIAPQVDPDFTTAYIDAFDENDELEPLAPFTFQKVLPGAVGAFTRERTVNADSEGHLEVALLKNTQYSYKYKQGERVYFTTTSADTFALPKNLSQ